MALPKARTWISITVCVALAGVAVYFMRIGNSSQAAGKHFERLMEPGEFIWPNSDIVLRRTYTGIAPLDTGFSFLVAAFFPGVRGAGMNGAFEQQQPYFLMQFAPIFAAMSIEAGRTRNYLTVLSFTTIWALLFQTVGGAIIIPLWFAFYFYTTSKADYWQKPYSMSPATAQGLFIAFLVGYIIPTAAIYLPGLSTDTRQILTAVWQPSPLYVNIIWAILSRTLPGSETERPKQQFSDPTYWIKFMHTSTIIASTIFHWILIYNCIFSKNPDVTFINVLIPIYREEWTMSQALLFIFQIDFWIIIIAGLFFAFISVGDLFELGMTNIDATTGAMFMLFLTHLLGPGAAISFVCIWREDRMMNTAIKRARDAAKKAS